MTTEEMIADAAFHEIVRLKKEKRNLHVVCMIELLALVAALVVLWI